jgi:hypothetical protein
VQAPVPGSRRHQASTDRASCAQPCQYDASTMAAPQPTLPFAHVGTGSSHGRAAMRHHGKHRARPYDSTSALLRAAPCKHLARTVCGSLAAPCKHQASTEAGTEARRGRHRGEPRARHDEALGQAASRTLGRHQRRHPRGTKRVPHRQHGSPVAAPKVDTVPCPNRHRNRTHARVRGRHRTATRFDPGPTLVVL